MNQFFRSVRSACMACLLLVAGTGLAQAAADKTYEVVTVDGNTLVLQEQSGAAQEYVAAPDFRMTVDGKPLAAADLKPGMRGTATVGTATTAQPVYVMNVKMGTVVAQTGRSVTFKEENGEIHRFTQSEADARGLKIYMDNKPVRIFNLNPGDKISATIVSTNAPEILTAQALDESLAAAGDAAANGAAATPAPTPVATPAPARDATVDATPPKNATNAPNRMWLWLVVLVIVALLVFFAVRRPKPRIPIRVETPR